MKAIMLITVGALALLQTGCATPRTEREQSTLLGAGIGAGLGAILGHNLGHGTREERALGAAAGALLGGALGDLSGRGAEAERDLRYLEERQFLTTVWVVNSNGSKTPVQLRQTEGGRFIGPRGEYYDELPTQDQLFKLYGM